MYEQEAEKLISSRSLCLPLWVSSPAACTTWKISSILWLTVRIGEMPCEKHSYSIWHSGCSKMFGFPLWIYDFNLPHKTAAAVNESSLSLSFPLLQAWWPAYGRCLIQIWQLIAFAEKGRMLRPAYSKSSGSYRCQRAWVDLSPAWAESSGLTVVMAC